MSNSTGRPTDHRNLDLNQFNKDVVFGRANGMIIWQPRIGCWFADREWSNEPLPIRYQGMSHNDVYRDLGCSSRPYGEYIPCYKVHESPLIERGEKWLDDTHLCEFAETPVGSMHTISRKSENSHAMVHEKRWIETPEEMKVAAWICDHSEWSWDQDLYDRMLAECGDLAAPQMYIPRVNVQDLYINTMGVEAGVYAIYEWGSAVDDYFRALHERDMRMIDAINASPIEIVNFGDNLHCATLPPYLFEKYVLPAYLGRTEKLHKAGKFVNSHWDGDTKSILKYARTCGLDGIEAITPQPQGDVTLEEIKEALGDDVYLLDGIPAILFDDIYSEDELIAFTQRVIELFAPKLVLGISDEISSTGDIERIRTVGKIVDDYNASLVISAV